MKKIIAVISGLAVVAATGFFLYEPNFSQPSAEQPTADSTPEVEADTSRAQNDSEPKKDTPPPVAKTKATPTPTKSPQQTLVRTDKPEVVAEQAKKLGIAVTAEIKLPSGDTLLTLNKGTETPAVTALAVQVPGAKVSPNYTYKAFLTPNDTNYSGQWNLAKIGAPAGWDISAGSSDVTIAVIDTGVLFNQSWGTHDYSQPDFPSSKMWVNAAETAGNGIDDDSNGYIDDREGWDFMGGFRGPDTDCPNLNDPDDYEDPDDSNFLYMDNDPQPYSCDSPNEPAELNKTHFDGTCDTFFSACAVGHGTMVASVAAAASNNNSLIAGVDHNAKIMNLRVMDGYGFSDSLRIIAAVEYAAEMGADVINMSLGLFTSLDDCSGTDAQLETAMASAKAAGVTIVAASGNTSSSGVCFPAKSSHAIAVGASTSNDSRASFSTYGAELDVIAPGVGIPSANAVSNADPTEYIEVGGTSFASPHVAGLAATLKELLPDSSPDDARTLITQFADKVSGMNGQNFTHRYGFGRASMLKSLGAVAITHPDGTLIRQAGQAPVYLIEDGKRRWIPTRQVFNSYRFELSKVKTATYSDIDMDTGVNLAFREGTLVQGSGSPVYVIDHNGASVQKRHISSRAAFEGLGFTWKEVMKIPDNQLPALDGPPVSGSDLHPDGILVRQAGQAPVYLLAAGARQWIPNREVFTSYSFRFDDVKNATSADMALTTGSGILLKEGTLIQAGSPVYAVNHVAGGGVEKRHIITRATFDLLGFTFTEVLKVPSGLLPSQTGSSIGYF